MKKTPAIVAAFIISVGTVLSACGEPQGPGQDRSALTEPPRLAGRLSGVESWGYQLQHVNLDELAVSDFDLLVIDYADDTGEPFTADQIERLQASGKIVLSYFSIGEAEIYRPYWNPAWVTGGDCDAPLSDDAPGWLEEANPDWCGNYPVQYWDVEWQAIIMGYLDAILAAGFDGVYLDKVDSFYAWTGEEDLGSSFAYSNAAVDMAALVEAIAARGRAADPHFLVVPQNAAEIIEYLDGDQRAAYLAAIDGIGVEDTLFYPEQGQDENAPYSPQQYVIDLLTEYQAAGLPIFAVDYLSEPDKMEQFVEEARERGYIPYAGVRELDRLLPAP